MTLIAAFDIPLAGISLVTPNVSQRLHWAEKGRRAKALRGLAYMSVPSHVRGGKPTARRCISLNLVRGKGQRMLDGDAVPMALKHLVDGLVDAGQAVDDNEKWLELTYHQSRDGGPARCGVIVYEL